VIYIRALVVINRARADAYVTSLIKRYAVPGRGTSPRILNLGGR
jgi:hypothetical protein